MNTAGFTRGNLLREMDVLTAGERIFFSARAVEDIMY